MYSGPPTLLEIETSRRVLTMRIVVIGGTGLIGSKLVQQLTEHGHDAWSALSQNLTAPGHT